MGKKNKKHKDNLRFSFMACDDWEHRKTCEERGHPTDHAFCAFPPFGLRTMVCACGKVTGDDATIGEILPALISPKKYDQENGL